VLFGSHQELGRFTAEVAVPGPRPTIVTVESSDFNGREFWTMSPCANTVYYTVKVQGKGQPRKCHEGPERG